MNSERNLAYAKTLSALIQAETVSAVGQTDLTPFYQFHDLLRSFFPKLFALVEEEIFDGSLLLRWKGTDDRLEPVLFMSHHDVVEASGNWTHPPFSGAIADGKLWGRGTLDTKGNLWAILQAAEELAASGFQPRRDTYFVSACNEETTGHGGDTISSELKKRGLRFFAVYDEGGMIVKKPIVGVEGTFAMIGVGEKGMVNLKFIARSKGGHASTPGRNTPLVRLGKFMAAVDKSNCFKIKMSPTVQEMFRRMAPGTKGVMNAVCTRMNQLHPLVAPAAAFAIPAAGAMVRTTIAFTMASGSEGSNVLPQEASVIGNMRFSHHQGKKGSINAISKLAKRYGIETVVLDESVESPLTDFNGAPFKLVEEAVSHVFPDVHCAPYVMNGASDSRYYSRVSDHCIRFAPFVIDNKQLDSVHAIDENVDVASLSGAVDFFKYMMEHN